MPWRLVEGSQLSVTCPSCGNEAFVVTVIEGEQRFRCQDTWHTAVIRFSRDASGDIRMETMSR